MSWSDKEIDNLFKENAYIKSFEYKDEYWKEMEAMLPSKKGKDFLWMFTSIAFIGLLFMSEVIGENGINSKSQVNDSLIAESYSQQSLNENKSEVIDDEVVSEQMEQMEEMSANNESNDSSNLDNSSVEKPEKAISNAINGSATSIDLDEKTTNTTSAVSIITSNKRENNISVNSDLISVVDDSGDGTIKNNQSTNNHNFNIQEVLSLKPLINIEGSVSLREIQSSEAPIASPIKPIQAKVYIAALGSLSQSMITPSDKVSSSFGLGAGVQFRKGGFLFNLGLNGTIGIHNDILLSRESKVYGFGSTFYKYELKYNNIYSLEGDLAVGFQLRKSIFSVGVRPSYVVGTKVGMRTEENGTSFNQESYYGYLDGINRFGIKPMIGYTYKFGSSLTLGLNLGMQLMSLVKDDFVNGVSNKFPIDGQLILKKTLNFNK
ncbi:MAG: hypothetical protein KC454_10675 [Flavobacteriales bacterium]|nr:hypothetical protein [Flavobacteriales bacterium]